MHLGKGAMDRIFICDCGMLVANVFRVLEPGPDDHIASQEGELRQSVQACSRQGSIKTGGQVLR